MAINEIQRQAYLKAMGITSYFPRFVLPGAAPSSLCDWPVDAPVGRAVPAMVDTTHPAQQRTRGEGQSSLPNEAPDEKETSPPVHSSALQKTPVPSRQGGQSPPYETGSNAAKPTSAQLHFKVALIPLGEGLAVLDQLPVMGNGQLPPSHFRLLRNLLRACGLPGPSGETLIMPFQWPLLELSHIDKGAEAACSALQAFIEHHCQEQGLEYLLLMGPALARELYGEAGELGLGLQRFADQNWQTLVTESLGQVLKVGALKRSLWQSLKSLSLNADAR